MAEKFDASLLGTLKIKTKSTTNHDRQRNGGGTLKISAAAGVGSGAGAGMRRAAIVEGPPIVWDFLGLKSKLSLQWLAGEDLTIYREDCFLVVIMAYDEVFMQLIADRKKSILVDASGQYLRR